MPFTLSHAAAALPLRFLFRESGVFPALVIGCFIPDVPYFLPDPLYEINAHAWPGFVLFGIPCGWAIYALWYGLLLRPSRALLPRRYASLLTSSEPRVRWVATTLSFLAGAATHVVWDAFTHRRGAVVQAWPALAHHVRGAALPPYELLQHASTIVGLAWLALHVRNRLRDAETEESAAPEWPLARRIVVISALALCAAIGVWSAFSGAAPLRLSAYNFVCRCVSSAAVVAALYALAWHAVYRIRGTSAGTRRR